MFPTMLSHISFEHAAGAKHAIGRRQLAARHLHFRISGPCFEVVERRLAFARIRSAGFGPDERRPCNRSSWPASGPLSGPEYCATSTTDPILIETTRTVQGGAPWPSP
jgi:hypothetical protein